MVCDHKLGFVSEYNRGGELIVVSECGAKQCRCVPTKANAESLAVESIVPCEGCPLYESEKEGVIPVSPAIHGSNSRHLIYHIWPRSGSVWRWNVEQLLKRISQFNGVRTIGIAMSADCDSVDEVKSMFANYRIDNWIIEPNQSNKGEGVTFWRMLATLPKDSGVTFYAHSKGARHIADAPEFAQIRRWAEMMYSTLLDNPSRGPNALKTHWTAGCFRQMFSKPVGHPYPCDWIYSGTFFWFRNEALNRPEAWTPIESYYGVEYWPGEVFERSESVCLLGNDCGYLYHKNDIDRWEGDFKKMSEEKGNFCYFTGTNRQGEANLFNSLINSARAAGVNEDFHVFSPFPYHNHGVIHHPVAANRDWKNHMMKVELLQELAELDYEYFVWLDSDNFFTKHPGDLSELIRDNPIWMSMEEDLLKSIHGDWWELKFDEFVNKYTPRTGPIVNIMRSFGIVRDQIWSTNGGMWIVRKEAIKTFAEYVFAVWNQMRALGFPRMSDEPPLAVVGQTMIHDPEKNTFDNHSHIWACDWDGHYKHKLPDGKPWRYKDWTTNKYREMITPAIVHNMKGKVFMAGSQNSPITMPMKEPVGTKLAEILKECGIVRPAGCDCNRWTMQMNMWGIAGCVANRRLIVDHLTKESKKASWMDAVKVAAKGYLTIDSLVTEAIRRAAPEVVPTPKPTNPIIPIYINARNLLTPLKSMVEYLKTVPNARPIIVDNASTWRPLLEWYKSCGVEVLMTGVNGGHLAWAKHMLNHAELGIDKYVVTDSDLILDNVPKDMLELLAAELDSSPDVKKVGLSLETEIPNEFPYATGVRGWEAQFWHHRHNDRFWRASIDTTFAMRRAFDPVETVPNGNHLRADRPYTAIHWPWTWTLKGLTDEQRHYIATSTTSTMWTAKMKELV